MSPDSGWWRGRFLRALQFNIEDPYGFYADRVDEEFLLGLVERVHADVLIVFARDGWGRVFYPGSRLYPRHPRARLDLSRLAREARRRGVKLVVMVDHTANQYLYRLHPEWAQRSRGGEVLVLEHYPLEEEPRDPEWPLICVNSPGFREFFVPEAREALEATGADGVLLDSFRYLPDPERACYCSYCRARFREETGMELPERDDMEDPAFRRAWLWRHRVAVEALGRLREAVKSVRGDALFFYNNHPLGWAGRGLVVAEKARDLLDAVFAELSEADTLGLVFAAIAVKLSRAAVGEGKPVFATRNLFYELRTVQSPPAPVVRQGVRLIAASGGNPVATVFSSQVFEDPRALDALAEAYEGLDRARWVLERQRPLPYTAILFDVESFDLAYWREPSLYFSELAGLALMHIHLHLPWSIVSARDLAELPQRYPAAAAPAMAMVDEREEEALRRYVEQGGVLAATHEFGVMRSDFTYTHRLALQEEAGIRYEGTWRPGYFYVRLAGEGPWEGLPGSIVFGGFSTSFRGERADPRLGELVRITPAGARVLAWAQAARASHGYEYTLGRSTPPPGPVLEGQPAVTLAGAGRGRIIYYAARLGAHYARTGHPDYRELYARLLASAAPPPAWSTAPETVYIDYYTLGDAAAVHLVNLSVNERVLAAHAGPSRQSPPGVAPGYMVHPARSVTPVHGVEIHLRLDWGKARAWDAVTGESLEATTEDGVVKVRIPRLDEYMLVVVEPRG